MLLCLPLWFHNTTIFRICQALFQNIFQKVFYRANCHYICIGFDIMQGLFLCHFNPKKPCNFYPFKNIKKITQNNLKVTFGCKKNYGEQYQCFEGCRTYEKTPKNTHEKITQNNPNVKDNDNVNDNYLLSLTFVICRFADAATWHVKLKGNGERERAEAITS